MGTWAFVTNHDEAGYCSPRHQSHTGHHLGAHRCRCKKTLLARCGAGTQPCAGTAAASSWAGYTQPPSAWYLGSSG